MATKTSNMQKNIHDRPPFQGPRGSRVCASSRAQKKKKNNSRVKKKYFFFFIAPKKKKKKNFPPRHPGLSLHLDPNCLKK